MAVARNPCGNLLRAVVILISGVAAAEPLPVEDCVRLALARSPAAQVAGFEVTADAARVRAARAAYGPRITAHAEYGRSAGFDDAVTNGGSTAALITIEAALFDGGLRDAQLAAARAHLRSTQARERQRRADIALEVRTAYFTALAADAEATIQHDAARVLRNSVDLLQRQERQALVTANDVLRAQLGQQTAEVTERAARAETETAVAELAAFIGIDLAAAQLLPPASASAPEAVDATLDTSPVLEDARAAAEAAQHEADAVRSEWRSHVDVSASAGALGVNPVTTLRHNQGGEFLLGFNLPLYDGGATAARVVAALAAAHAAAASVQDIRRRVHIELARTVREAQQSAMDAEAWRRAIPQSADHFALMRARYFGGGNVRLLEVLDALTQSTDTRLNLERAVLRQRLAVAMQRQILGQSVP